jgi:hypothetical protein
MSSSCCILPPLQGSKQPPDPRNHQRRGHCTASISAAANGKTLGGNYAVRHSANLIPLMAACLRSAVGSRMNSRWGPRVCSIPPGGISFWSFFYTLPRLTWGFLVLFKPFIWGLYVPLPSTVSDCSFRAFPRYPRMFPRFLYRCSSWRRPRLCLPQ